MPSGSNTLRQAVLDELRRQRELAQPRTRPTGNKFGQFLRWCLVRRRISDAEFATRLNLEPELANAILEGILPQAEMDDELVAEIAGLLNYEQGVLRAIMKSCIDADT